MSQIFHIVRKDARHHWPEISLSLAVLIAYACMQPRTWTDQHFNHRFLDGFINFLPALLVLSWIFLIVRLVQGESLVGDRQFWLTRPYEWHKLLCAKLLSIVLFIHVPLFLMQLTLLQVAKFPVISSIPSLLLVHLMFVMALWLPSLTLGSITSGIGQAALTVLIVVLLTIGIAYLSSVLPDSEIGTDALDDMMVFIFIGACASAILIQFIRRRALLSRLIISAGALLIVATAVLSSYLYSGNSSFPLPTANAPAPAQFALDRGLLFATTDTGAPEPYSEDLELEIPIQVSGLGVKTLAQIRGTKLDLDLPSGEHWTSHWQSTYHNLSYGRTHDWPAIKMKRALFYRIKDSSVHAHLSLGFNVYKLGGATETLMAGDRMSLPVGGRCLNEMFRDTLRCFSALKSPGSFFIMAELPSSSCEISKADVAEGWSSSPAFFANLSGDSPPDLQLSPIYEFEISLSRHYLYEDHQTNLPICAGTPLYISKLEFLYPVRSEIDLGEIKLAHYAPGFPRKVVPPTDRHTLTPQDDTLSFNFLRPLLGFPRSKRN